MKNTAKLLFLVLTVLYLYTACTKEPCEEDIPVIEYNRFERIMPDTFLLVYDFVDCEGNIGLESDDDDPPFDRDSEYFFNFWVDLYFMENGEWQLYDFGDGPGLNDRIRRIFDDGRSRPVEGEIEKFIDASAFDPDLDTIKFRAVLIDRALNKSFPADSDPIVLSRK